MAVVNVADVIVPEIFVPYMQQMTEALPYIVQSGVVARDPLLDQFLAGTAIGVGGGLTFNIPSWKPLANDTDNVSTDNEGSSSTPKETSAVKEVAVRLSRNQSWSSMDLARALAGPDPMASIASQVALYWARRVEAACIATFTGIFADNDAAPSGTEHVQGDLTNNISGGAYVAGLTDFSAAAFIDTLALMQESEQDLGAVLVHPVVYARMRKNNLIDFIPDSQNSAAAGVPSFFGRQVIQSRNLPNASGVYDTWILGSNAMRWGVGAPPVPVEVDRAPAAGDGGGQEILYSRVEWIIHPTGYAYAGTAPSGGPSNANTSNNLANAGSWIRRYAEREMIKIARLKTREA